MAAVDVSQTPMGLVEQKYASGVRSIRSHLRNYWLNHAFILGHQWLKWDAQRDQLNRLPVQAGRIRATWNRMRANTRITVAQLTQRNYIFECLPSAADDASQRGAKIVEAILVGLHDTHDWEGLRERNAHALWKGGTTAIAVEWDVENETTVETMLSLSEFVVEAGVQNGETARWWCKNQALPPLVVQAMFPEAFEDGPPPPDAISGVDPHQMRMIIGNTSDNGSEDTPLTTVLTYFERPNPRTPEGRTMVEVDGRVIQDGLWPYPFKDRLNIAIAHETVVENHWAGRTILDDVRPLQIAYNAARSGLLEHLRDCTAAKLAVETQNAALMEQRDDMPGGVMEYLTGTNPPRYIAPAMMADWVGQAPHEIAEEIDDLMGVHDVSRGIAPGAIESGLGVQILAEADATPIGRMLGAMVRQMEKVARMAIAIHAEEIKSERTDTVPDSWGPITHVWTGRDIKGQQNIQIPLDAVMPRNRAAARAVADSLVQAGLIKDVQTFARVAELPNQREILSALSADHAKAGRENHKFALGIHKGDVQVPIIEDNHSIHIESHLIFIKSERFEQLGEHDQEHVRIHIKVHREFAAEEAAEGASDLALNPAMANVPSATGGPGAGGSPGAPPPPEPPVIPSPENAGELPELPPPGALPPI